VLAEHAAVSAPVVDALLASQNRLTRDGLVRPAGLRGAQLGQLPVALGLDGVVGLALGDHLGLVVGQLLSGQVTLLFGGGAGRCPLVAQLVEQVGHGRYLRRPDAVGGRRASAAMVLRQTMHRVAG
jgi:hypothetical protein